MVADELRRQADEFVDLTQMIARIGRDPGERAERSPRQGDHRRPQGQHSNVAQPGEEPIDD
jgi:hypothetical protein